MKIYHFAKSYLKQILRIPAAKILSVLFNRMWYLSDLGYQIREFEARIRSLELNFLPNELAEKRILQFFELIQPIQISGEKKRFGRLGDGGYVLPLLEIGGFAHLGVADDVSPSMIFAKQGVPVHLYDYSIEKLPEEHKNFLFYKEKIGSADDGDTNLKTVVDRFNHSEDLGGIVDIEGYEYSYLANATQDKLLSFAFMAVEFHNLDLVADDFWWHTALESLTNMSKTHYVVHLHSTNYFPLINIGKIRSPRQVEVTFARKDLVNFEGYDINPGDSPLDSPHVANRPEHSLKHLFSTGR